LKRIVTVIFGIIAVIVVALIGAVLVMDDADLEGLIASVPGAAPHATGIVAIKRDTYDGIAYWIDDTWYGLRAMWWDASRKSGSGPRFVLHLEPVRTPPPAPPAEPVTTPSAMSAPAPVKLVPEQEPAPPPEAQPPAAEPATPEPPAAAPVPTPPPAPVEAETTPPAPPPEAVPVEKVETAELTEKPAPEKKPTAAENKPEPEVAAKTPPPEKPAAPPAPETTTGDADHKRGLTFYKDLGVAKNFKTAGEWFEKAAAKGHPAAQYNLGIMSYLGQGRDQDYTKAADWFRMAAEQDHALAQYNLGFLYYEGKGVQKDDLQAFMWIDRAANLGDEKAKKASETLRKILPKDIFEKQ